MAQTEPGDMKLPAKNSQTETFAIFHFYRENLGRNKPATPIFLEDGTATPPHSLDICQY